LQALNRALADRPVPAGIIHHSDQGIQYASADLVDRLLERGFQISMSRKASPWENGRVESFIKTLKAEEVSLRQYRNLAEARRLIGHFLDQVYNQQRLHSALGYLPPPKFERDWHDQNKKEAATRLLPYEFFQAWGNLSLR